MRPGLFPTIWGKNGARRVAGSDPDTSESRAWLLQRDEYGVGRVQGGRPKAGRLDRLAVA